MSKHYPNPFNPPFHYEEIGGCVMDSENRIVLEVRGWGYLTGRCGLNLSDKVACGVQDRFGRHLAELLNQDHPDHEQQKGGE